MTGHSDIKTMYLKALSDGTYVAAEAFAGETSDLLIEKEGFYILSDVTPPIPEGDDLKRRLEDDRWKVFEADKLKPSLMARKGGTAFDCKGLSPEALADEAAPRTRRQHDLQDIETQFAGLRGDRFGDTLVRDHVHAWALGTVKNYSALIQKRLTGLRVIEMRLWRNWGLGAGAGGFIGGAMNLLPLVKFWAYMPPMALMLPVGLGMAMATEWNHAESVRQQKKLLGTFVNLTAQSSLKIANFMRVRKSALLSDHRHCWDMADKLRLDGGAQNLTNDWPVKRQRTGRLARWLERRLEADARVMQLHSDMIPTAYSGLTARVQFQAHFTKDWLWNDVFHWAGIGAALMILAGLGAYLNAKSGGLASAGVLAMLTILFGHMLVRLTEVRAMMRTPDNPDIVFDNIASARPDDDPDDDPEDRDMGEHLRYDALRQMYEAQLKR